MYYYINTQEPDIIIKTDSLIDTEEFSGTITRMSDDNKELLCYEIGDYSQQWVTKYFKLMTDEDLKNEGITREYLYQELPDGGYIIVREMNYYKDGKMFDGILDYFSTDDNEDMFIGNLISGNTSDYKKIDGMERDSLILLERENLEMFDNWLTPSEPLVRPTNLNMELPEVKGKYTVIYLSNQGGKPTIKKLHIMWGDEDINDLLEEQGISYDKVSFIFDGHLEETES